MGSTDIVQKASVNKVLLSISTGETTGIEEDASTVTSNCLFLYSTIPLFRLETAT